ncbi:MAG: rhomboid family intramembrane serine protease [Gammaproteobacteria bacterium]
MFLPLKDDNPLRVIPFQLVTVAIIAACVAVFAYQASLGKQESGMFSYALGMIPAVLFDIKQLPVALAWVPAEATLITSMFLHGGFMHLAGNMLYLWIFGDNIEDAMGHGRFILFYLLCGIAAALTEAWMNPSSEIPMVGASGAISGVLGAYLILHPRRKVLVLVLFRILLPLPAYVVLGAWIGIQFLSLGQADSNVAWWAHIGGFVAGVLLIVPFRRRSVPLFN